MERRNRYRKNVYENSELFHMGAGGAEQRGEGAWMYGNMMC